MFVHKKFDVEIIRRLDEEALSWPKPGEACLDMGLGGNRSYLDLRQMRWVEARRVLQLEEQLISRIEAAVDWSDASEGLLVLKDGEWTVLRVPYPMGFYTKWMDGRIDDPDPLAR